MPSIAEIRQQYPQYSDMSDQALADALYKKYYSDMPRQDFDSKVGLAPVAQPAPAQTAQAPAQDRSMMDWLLGRNLSPEQQAETDAWQQSLSAKPTGPSGAENMVQGMIFNRADDLANLVGAKGLADQLNEQQAAFRKAHPVGSMVYEGLGSAIGAAGAGKVLSAAMPGVAAAMNPVGRTIGRRALRYGAAGGLGSGVAASGEQDATLGSVAASTALGTGLGVATPFVGRAAQGVYNKVAGVKPSVPQIAGGMEDMLQQAKDAADDFAGKATTKYQELDAAGVVINPQSADALRNRILSVAKITSPEVSKDTIALQELVRKRIQPRAPLSMEQLHTLSAEMNSIIGDGLKKTDKLYVPSMKRALDDFLWNIQPQDLLNGTPENVGLLKQADRLYAQKMKLEFLSKIIDDADRGTGQYTQSQIANTIRREANKLYKGIRDKKVRGFTLEEMAFVRKMAKSQDVGAFTRWLARFAPRGPVSAMSGGGIGSGIGMAAGTLVGGPGAGTAIGGMIGGAAGPAAGYIAGNAADKAAVRSLGRLASSAAYGPGALANSQVMLPSNIERLLLPAGVGASTAIGQRVQ
jgi:hypothetical protein